jgi:hypothetical protein
VIELYSVAASHEAAIFPFFGFMEIVQAINIPNCIGSQLVTAVRVIQKTIIIVELKRD